MDPAPPPRKAAEGLSVPLAGPALALILGIGIGLAGPPPPLSHLSAALAGLLGCMAAALICQNRWLAVVCAGLLFMGTGIALVTEEQLTYYIYSNKLESLAPLMERGDTFRLEGITTAMPVPDKWAEATEASVLVKHIWITNERHTLNLPILLKVYHGSAPDFSWNRGDRIQFLARLTFPRGFRNFGVQSPVIYYWNRNIVALASCKTPALLTIVRPTRAGPLARLYRRTEHLLDTTAMPDQHRQIAKALLLGRSISSPDLRNKFANAGIFHLLVISGLHLTLLAAIIAWLLSWLPLPRFVHHGLLLIALTGYVGFIDAKPAVLRAFIVIAIFLLGRMLNRTSTLLNATALAAIFLLAAHPLSLLEVGFQLTFAAMLGLALVFPRLRDRYVIPLKTAVRQVYTATIDLASEAGHHRARRWRFALERFHFFHCSRLPHLRYRRILQIVSPPVLFLADITLATFVVLTFSLPFLAAAHLPVSPRALVMGPPALALITPGLVLLLMLVPCLIIWPVAATGLLWMVNALIDGLLYLTGTMHLPPIFLTTPGLFLIVLYLGVVILLSRRRWHPLLPSLLAVGLFVFLWLLPGPAPSSPTLTMLDVGEGESLLLRTPDGHNMLIDTGGIAYFTREAQPTLSRGDLSRRVLIPVLTSRGIHRLDGLILTHFDYDHAGSAAGLIRDFPVEKVFCSGPELQRRPELARVIEATATARNIPLQPLYAGDELAVGPCRLAVLHPSPDFFARSANANSLVLRLSAHPGNWSALLTGDVPRSVETSLLARRVLRPVTVLKCAHHGSRTSSSEAFLHAIQPRLVVISAGTPWRFSHPSPVITTRFRRLGIPWVSTYRHGQITLILNSNDPGLTLPQDPWRRSPFAQ